MIKLLKNLTNQIKNYDTYASKIIDELLIKIAAQVDDLILQYPQYESELSLASNSVKPAHLRWVIKQLDRQEPIDEIINMIEEFEKNKQKLEKKDLFQYQSLGELRGSINEIGLSRSKKKQDLKQSIDGQYEVIYEDSNFIVVHPHSKEASCYFGKGTQWCVAATVSKNYFEGYSLDNIFLYYILSKQLDPENPDLSKIAFAYAKYEERNYLEIFDSKDKMIEPGVVWSYIKKISNSDDIPVTIDRKIIDHLLLQENTKYRSIIENLTPEEYKSITSQMKDEKELLDFNYRVAKINKSNLIINEIVENIFKNLNIQTNSKQQLIYRIVDNPNVSSEIIENIIYHILIQRKILSYDFIQSIMAIILKNPKTDTNSIDKIWDFLNKYLGDKVEHMISYFMSSPNISDDLLSYIYLNYFKKSHFFNLFDHVSSNINLNNYPQFENLIFKNIRLLPSLIHNNSTSQSRLDELTNLIYSVDFFEDVEDFIENNYSKFMNKYRSAEAYIGSLTIGLLKNKNLSENAIRLLVENEHMKPYMLLDLYRMPALESYPNLLEEFSKSDVEEIRLIASRSKFTPKHILEKLLKDPSELVNGSAYANLFD